MGIPTDFMGEIPVWSVVLLLIFLAIFVLVFCLACLKCSQSNCETPYADREDHYCPTCYVQHARGEETKSYYLKLWPKVPKTPRSSTRCDDPYHPGPSSRPMNERTTLLNPEH